MDKRCPDTGAVVRRGTRRTRGSPRWSQAATPGCLGWDGNERYRRAASTQIQGHAQLMTKRNYKTLDGSQKIWRVGDPRPDDIDGTHPLVPMRERIELGRLRWAIEQYVAAGGAAASRSVHKTPRSGWREGSSRLSEEGVYDHFFWVQTAAHTLPRPRPRGPHRGAGDVPLQHQHERSPEDARRHRATAKRRRSSARARRAAFGIQCKENL